MADPFGVRFGEAINYLKGKLPEASLAWDDLAGPVHGKVFTVAGATTADLARDLHQALTDALAKGSTLATFRKDFDQIVQAHGWTYRGTRGWRTGVMFGANMRSAHMAGRWAQLQANKDRRPFLQYRTAGDAKVRPAHRKWNSFVAHIDDPIWSVIYPPNGWGCRCTVRAYSQAELDYKSISISAPIKLDYRDVVNRDGVITDRVPVGIDLGWDHNVGQSWIAPELALGAKLARLPRELQGYIVDKTITPAFQEALNASWKGFQSAMEAAPAPRGAAQVVGFLDSATLGGLADLAPQLNIQSTAVAATDAVARSTVWPKDWLARLPENVRNYQAVLWDAQAQTMVIVPQGQLAGGRLATVALRQVRSQMGQSMAIQELGTASATVLAGDARYQVLVGRLPGQ